LAHRRWERRIVASTFADNKGKFVKGFIFHLTSDGPKELVQMSSNPARASPPAAGANESGNDASRADQRRRNNRNRCSGNREPKFEGKCSEIKNSVYDVVSGKDTVAKTTREIAEYVGREFDDAGEFRTGMVEMRLPPLTKPPPPLQPTH
jgi:hypothetical protein